MQHLVDEFAESRQPPVARNDLLGALDAFVKILLGLAEQLSKSGIAWVPLGHVGTNGR